ARRHDVLEAHAPTTQMLHPPHDGAADAEELGHDPDEVLRDVDQHEFHRLLDGAVALAYHHCRLRHLELESLAAHRLDQDRELELAAPEDAEGVRRLGLLDPQADVPPAYLDQPLPHHP